MLRRVLRGVHRGEEEQHEHGRAGDAGVPRPKTAGADGVQRMHRIRPIRRHWMGSLPDDHERQKSAAAAKAALIAALATDPEPRTGKLLLMVSKNPNWVLRVAAMEAIDKRGDPALLSGIEPGLSDYKREVRFTAAAAVIRLSDVAQAQQASVPPPQENTSRAVGRRGIDASIR
jgi:HEAT repeat protein